MSVKMSLETSGVLKNSSSSGKQLHDVHHFLLRRSEARQRKDLTDREGDWKRRVIVSYLQSLQSSQFSYSEIFPSKMLLFDVLLMLTVLVVRLGTAGTY